MLHPNQIFLVGGAVRDHFMNLAVRDRDYVVVGSTPDQMLSLGFAQVGKDFPVFLDAKGEEYALARIERKIRSGYHGFEMKTENVTLEDDLQRRDLTINSMAMTNEGNIIDPFGGLEDIKNKILRHTSEAFAEDPVRVLRVARFAARYAEQGFTVAPETMNLMKTMVQQGEVDHLVPERVWMEFVKATQTSKPSVFLRVLHDCGALQRVMPEVDALYGVPQVAQYHPEIDTGVHNEMVLDQAVKLAPGNIAVAFAALTHDLGKALTPPTEWPKHHEHEKLGLDPLKIMVKRLKPPTHCIAVAEIVCEHHLRVHRAMESRTGSILKLIEIAGLRQEQRLHDVLLACEADKRGRLGMETGEYPQRALVEHVAQAVRNVSGQKFADLGLSGEEIKAKMHHARLQATTRAIGEFKRSLKDEKDLTHKLDRTDTAKAINKPKGLG